MKNRCKIDTQKHRKIDAKMAPKIRPRAACARRGVVGSLSVAPLLSLLLPLHALSLKGTLSSHSFSALSLFIVCRRHLSLIWLRNNFLFMCWMECCAGYKQFRASFRIPFWDQFTCFFGPFPLTVFGNVFFMIFYAFHLPFFNAFSMNFPCNSHHFFGCFSGTFFQQLARRKSSFFKILLFERHAFYTVNTMVLRHSAHRKSSVPISQKNEKYHFFASFRDCFCIENHPFSGT